MEKKWVYNLGRVLLILGIVLFIGSAISSFVSGYIAASKNLQPENIYKWGWDYLEEGFKFLIIGVLLVGFNRILNKIDEKDFS